MSPEEVTRNLEARKTIDDIADKLIAGASFSIFQSPSSVSDFFTKQRQRMKDYGLNTRVSTRELSYLQMIRRRLKPTQTSKAAAADAV